MFSLLIALSLATFSTAQVTCARAPNPSREPYAEVMFQRLGPRFEAGCPSDLVVYYAPPSPGTRSGVLRIITEDQGFRSIIRLNGPNPNGVPVLNANFWIDSTSECVTNFEAFTPVSLQCFRA
ncbi:hypothetical protein AG0111_0g4818 [Alternaria gaisen]|uniref:Uncharacterized protein n=1 Tax=Alternaria gaisen TaxID=167740 RepID=A0ACB6FRH0_9PLEO|nr:hypothetical protein AG0111_0g4818 [Alternaria gaisen]